MFFFYGEENFILKLSSNTHLIWPSEKTQVSLFIQAVCSDLCLVAMFASTTYESYSICVYLHVFFFFFCHFYN